MAAGMRPVDPPFIAGLPGGSNGGLRRRGAGGSGTGIGPGWGMGPAVAARSPTLTLP